MKVGNIIKKVKRSGNFINSKHVIMDFNTKIYCELR